MAQRKRMLCFDTSTVEMRDLFCTEKRVNTLKGYRHESCVVYFTFALENGEEAVM